MEEKELMEEEKLVRVNFEKGRIDLNYQDQNLIVK